jgi:large subunit ribosomal protein L47
VVSAISNNTRIKNTIPTRGIEEFIDKTILEGKKMESAGRSWVINELRIKSFQDLQKLWFVLYKERNRLLTARLLAKSMGGRMHHPERLRKTQKSMAKIMQVVHERHAEARKQAREEFLRNKALGKYKWPPETQEDAPDILQRWGVNFGAQNQ